MHHGVRITDSALVAAATLSDRYIADRFLPDKAIDLMDEASSRLRMEMDSMPVELDEVERRRRQLEIERRALKKEEDSASKDRLGKLEKELSAVSYTHLERPRKFGDKHRGPRGGRSGRHAGRWRRCRRYGAGSHRQRQETRGRGRGRRRSQSAGGWESRSCRGQSRPRRQGEKVELLREMFFR